MLTSRQKAAAAAAGEAWGGPEGGSRAEEGEAGKAAAARASPTHPPFAGSNGPDVRWGRRCVPCEWAVAVSSGDTGGAAGPEGRRANVRLGAASGCMGKGRRTPSITEWAPWMGSGRSPCRRRCRHCTGVFCPLPSPLGRWE